MHATYKMKPSVTVFRIIFKYKMTNCRSLSVLSPISKLVDARLDNVLADLQYICENCRNSLTDPNCFYSVMLCATMLNPFGLNLLER
jgi:hypothetical protein